MPVSHSHQFLCVSLAARHARDELGIGGIGDVPDLVRPRRRTCAADRPRSDRPWAATCRRRRAPSAPPPSSPSPSRPGMCVEVFRLLGVGHVDDRGAVELGLAVERVDRLGHRLGAAVVADIGDVAVALLVDDRLIGAARLQVVASRRAACSWLPADRRPWAPAPARGRRTAPPSRRPPWSSSRAHRRSRLSLHGVSP